MKDLALTKREQEILNLVSQGIDNAEIAKSLNLSKTTVSTYISNVYKKIGLTENKGRGGKRQGAGRPTGSIKEDTKKLCTFRLSKEEEDAVRKLLKKMRGK
ncbi:helix-turn-helix transcriptional regulator [bacterium]|nr:helix-turn-helix transcriptional regulator [bacterium]